MSKKVKASFIVPVYNGELFIAEAIDSCLRQTEKNFEVVVVNDGSTDSTSDILAWFTLHDKRVVVLPKAENKGRSAARNAGIKAAKGDILLMLDADDLAHPERLKATLKHFAKHKETDIVYGKYQLIDSLDNPGPVVDEAGQEWNWQRVLDTKLTYIGHSTMAFRRQVLTSVAYTEGEWSSLGIDDWKLQVDAHKAGFKFGAIPYVLSYYRYKSKPRDEKRVDELKKEALSGIPEGNTALEVVS